MNSPRDTTLLRMIDANANRAREALRVMEDYARFALNDARISSQIKSLRHDLAAALQHGADGRLADAFLARDTPQDVGTTIKTAAELSRQSLGAVVIAAGKRLSEALRVIEECAKVLAPEVAAAVERLRYRGYTLEQVLSRFALGAAAGGGRERFGQVRVYVLLTEALCHASMGGWEKVLEAVLGAAARHSGAPAMPSPALFTGGGGKVCVQLREKELPDGELLRRSRIVAARCQQAGAISIINDRPDIALLAGADGVHLGQDDLPCDQVRKWAGADMIVGVSTERIEQARQAIAHGATYVAAGPMFPTSTKEKPRLAGPGYAAEAARELPPTVPVVAIGGITAENIGQLTVVGVRAVAVCSAVIAQADPGAAVAKLLAALRA